MPDPLIRPLLPADTDAFIALLDHLDRETPYLMFEPGERPVDRGATRARLSNTDPAVGTVLGAFVEPSNRPRELIGFLGAQRRQGRRNRHVMNLVVALRLAHVGQGHGRALLDAAIAFARGEGVHRLELTVSRNNARAQAVYRAAGFVDEGVRRDAVRLGKHLHDEIAMALLIDG